MKKPTHKMKSIDEKINPPVVLPHGIVPDNKDPLGIGKTPKTPLISRGNHKEPFAYVRLIVKKSGTYDSKALIMANVLKKLYPQHIAEVSNRTRISPEAAKAPMRLYNYAITLI